MKSASRSSNACLATGVVFGVCLVVTGCGRGSAGPLASASSGYAIGENTATAKAGPVRLARVSYVDGPVSWRPSSSVGWSRATTNLPLRRGAQIWAQRGSRGELLFDDGSTMRLGGGSLATLADLSSDDRGEYTEVRLNNGLATLHSRNRLSRYQFDTPYAAIESNVPSDLRVGVGNLVEAVCSNGSAFIDGPQGVTELDPGRRCDIADETSPYELGDAPPPDDWDRFDQNREEIYEHHDDHLPRNIDLVAGNLDDYGDWHQDPSNGYVWAPRDQTEGWRPYHDGRWVWTNPWGWTWVGDEPWGWAPYHYGTWVHEPYGWAWDPGPSQQYWSPAVVQFVDDGEDDDVGWAPLAPEEVQYPQEIDNGFRSGDWSQYFSIGQAGDYYPAGSDRCVGRPWDNAYANRYDNVEYVTNIYQTSYDDDDSDFVRNGGFIPRNAARFAGMTLATREAFVGGGKFRAVPPDPRGTIFRRGRSYARPPAGPQISGPVTVRPTLASFTPDRRFVAKAGPPPALVARRVFSRQHDRVASRSVPPRATMPVRSGPARAEHLMPPRAKMPPPRPAPALRRPSTQRPEIAAHRNVPPSHVPSKPAAPVIRRPGGSPHPRPTPSKVARQARPPVLRRPVAARPTHPVRETVPKPKPSVRPALHRATPPRVVLCHPAPRRPVGPSVVRRIPPAQPARPQPIRRPAPIVRRPAPLRPMRRQPVVRPPVVVRRMTPEPVRSRPIMRPKPVIHQVPPARTAPPPARITPRRPAPPPRRAPTRQPPQGQGHRGDGRQDERNR